MSTRMQYINQPNITYHVWKELTNREGLNVLKMDSPHQDITWPWNTQESRYCVKSRTFEVFPQAIDFESFERINRKDGSIDKEKLLEFIVSVVADELINEASENENICVALYDAIIVGETVRINNSISHNVLVRYIPKITGKE